MITAEQAREKTIAAKKDLDALFLSIDTMCKAGRSFSAHALEDVFDPQGYKNELEKLGFNVEIVEQHDSFKITW